MVVGFNGYLTGARYGRRYGRRLQDRADGDAADGRSWCWCNLLDRNNVFVRERKVGRYRGAGVKYVPGRAKRDEAPANADVGTRQKQISGATKGRMGFWVIGGIGGYKKMQMREDRLLCPTISVIRWFVSHTPSDCCC